MFIQTVKTENVHIYFMKMVLRSALIGKILHQAELQDLRQTSQQISALVDRLRRLLPQAPPATLVDQLSAHLVRQRQFFIKY